MPRSFLQILSAAAVAASLASVAALVAACARSDTTPRTAAANQPPAASASTATGAPTSAAASASGTLAAGATPTDSISERADHGRILGDSNATVWLVMASDFQCPFCKQWHDANFAAVMKNYVSTGRVRLAFLNFPLSIHPNALPAAEAAMCASVQNKFWPMHESLFATQAAWENSKNPNEMFDSLAVAAGVSMGPYRQCVSQHLTIPLIQADHDRGTRAGVRSTPTFFAGGQGMEGADANVAPALDSALARARGGRKPGS